MEEVLKRLEELLDVMSAPGHLDEALLKTLPDAWSEAVDALTKTVENRDPNTDLSPWRERLERVIQRMPQVQAQLAEHQSDIARQLGSENRRFQAFREHLTQGPKGAIFRRQA